MIPQVMSIIMILCVGGGMMVFLEFQMYGMYQGTQDPKVCVFTQDEYDKSDYKKTGLTFDQGVVQCKKSNQIFGTIVHIFMFAMPITTIGGTLGFYLHFSRMWKLPEKWLAAQNNKCSKCNAYMAKNSNYIVDFQNKQVYCEIHKDGTEL